MRRGAARLTPVSASVARIAARLDRVSDRLRLLSPYGVLERGYSLTTTADGAVVRDASSLAKGARIHTRFAVGEADSVVA